MIHRFLLLGLLLCGMGGVARADAERDRIATERAAANAKLADQEAVCNQKFAVSGCLEAARKENRATLSRLRHEELVLDEAKRHAAADARRKEIADKAAAQSSRASEPDAQEIAPVPRPAQRAGTFRPPAAVVPRPEGMPASGVSRSEQERINTDKFEARAREAQAHRVAIERRNAERAAQGKLAAPLPVPSAASGTD